MKPEEDINSHIMKFVTLLSESRLDKNSPAVMDFLRETLPVKLQVNELGKPTQRHWQMVQMGKTDWQYGQENQSNSWEIITEPKEQ